MAQDARLMIGLIYFRIFTKHYSAMQLLNYAEYPVLVYYFVMNLLGWFLARQIIITARIQRIGKVMFSFVCPSTPGGTPSPFHNTSTGPMSFLGVPQSQVGVAHPSKDRTGAWPRQDSGVPRPPARTRLWYPTHRTAEWILATQQAVSLLRSCRRTVLLDKCTLFFSVMKF